MTVSACRGAGNVRQPVSLAQVAAHFTHQCTNGLSNYRFLSSSVSIEQSEERDVRQPGHLRRADQLDLIHRIRRCQSRAINLFLKSDARLWGYGREWESIGSGVGTERCEAARVDSALFGNLGSGILGADAGPQVLGSRLGRHLGREQRAADSREANNAGYDDCPVHVPSDLTSRRHNIRAGLKHAKVGAHQAIQLLATVVYSVVLIDIGTRLRCRHVALLSVSATALARLAIPAGAVSLTSLVALNMT